MLDNKQHCIQSISYLSDSLDKIVDNRYVDKVYLKNTV